MNTSRLEHQIKFLVEIDKLKQVIRRNYLADASRRENVAEHSWHLAMMAMILSEYANTSIDAAKAMKMVLIHDIIEIEAGDTFAYDQEGYKDKAEREQQAARNLFGLLPEDQRKDLLTLWEEFEANQTPESRFANSLDRMLPLLQNYQGRGPSWQEYGITSNQVMERNRPIEKGSETLFALVKDLIERSVAEGILLPPDNTDTP